jgi:DNA polymerase III subunit beta
MERLLTIGEFAARCGLSRSALRFYDQNDLLRPCLVDEGSGYRYYGVEQLGQALLIQRLRAAEMPIGTLRLYLAASLDGRRAILEQHVESFRRRASAVQDAVDQLQLTLDGEARWCAIAPDELARALRQVSFAVADPAVRADLGGVWLETRDGSLRVVATDSYRLAVRDLVPLQIGPDGVRGVVDAGRLASLIDALSSAGNVRLSQSAAGVTAALDGRPVALGSSGEGFPDYERILSGTPVGPQIALARDDVGRALARLPGVAAEVRLRFESDRLLLEAQGSSAAVGGTWPGPALEIVVDRRFLAEAVTATVGPDLVIEAFDPLGPLTVRSADTGTFSVLTMPIGP